MLYYLQLVHKLEDCYYGTHLFVIFAPHGELLHFVATAGPHGATKKCVKLWRNVAQSVASKIKLLRQILLKIKKICATCRHVSLHIATVRYVSKSYYKWRLDLIQKNKRKYTFKI